MREELGRCDKELTATAEDKDPNALWFVAPWAMLLRQLAVIARAPSRWSLSASSVNNIVDWYRICFDTSVPKASLNEGKVAYPKGTPPAPTAR